MKRAKFPGLNSTRWIKLVEKAPEQAEGEPDAAFAQRREYLEAISDVELEVRMLDRTTVLEHQDALRACAAREDSRRAFAKGKGDTVGEAVSLAFMAEMAALHKQVVEKYVVGIRGLDVGEVNLDEVRDPKMLAIALDTAGLLADASSIARVAQFPSPVATEVL